MSVDPVHLRELAVTHDDHRHTAEQLRAAADEIERLRADNALLVRERDSAATALARHRRVAEDMSDRAIASLAH